MPHLYPVFKYANIKKRMEMKDNSYLLEQSSSGIVFQAFQTKNIKNKQTKSPPPLLFTCCLRNALREAVTQWKAQQ